MAVALVRSWGNTDTGNVTTLSVDVNTIGATANNLLIACLSIEGASDSSFTATGWTRLHEHYNTSGSALYASGALFWRTATATTADDFDPSWTTGRACAATIDEYSGLEVGAPEDSGESLAYVTEDRLDGLSINSGSATPTTANGIALAAYMGPIDFDVSTLELEISDSYTRSSFESATGSNPVAALAYKLYTSTAAQSPDWTSTKGNDWRGYGAIAVFKEPAGGGPIEIGIASDTSNAFSVTASKISSINQSAETDTAQVISTLKAAQLLQALESDNAFNISAEKSILISQILEINIIFALTIQNIIPIDLVAENDTTESIITSKIKAISQATESDISQQISAGIIKIVGLTSELNLSQLISKSKIKEIGQITENNLAQGITAGQAIALNIVNEINNTFSIEKLKEKEINQVLESDSVFNIVLPKDVQINFILETNFAYPIILSSIQFYIGDTKIFIEPKRAYTFTEPNRKYTFKEKQ